jgi:hypothetical protein
MLRWKSINSIHANDIDFTAARAVNLNGDYELNGAA